MVGSPMPSFKIKTILFQFVSALVAGGLQFFDNKQNTRYNHNTLVIQSSYCKGLVCGILYAGVGLECKKWEHLALGSPLYLSI